MEVVFNESEAIELWEVFTSRDYNEFLYDLKEGIYNYSKTAGTKINEFEFNLSDVIDKSSNFKKKRK